MADARVNLRSRWCRLRLTKAGWLFFFLTFPVAMAASKSNASMMMVICGVMLGALFISAVLAWRMLSAVRIRRDLQERAWQNETIHLAYQLRNVHRTGSCLGLTITEIAPKGIESAAGYCIHLPPRTVFRAGARFAAHRRGRIDLDGVEVSTTFPFGLVAARRFVPASASMLIWPAKGHLKHQLLYRGAVETSSATPSGATGGQDEFFGLREYRQGDNPRWIHWRRSATKRVPVIREMARPLPETLWLIVDTYFVNRFPESIRRRERLLRFAATLIDHAFSRGYRVGMALACDSGAQVLPPGEGRGQRGDLLDALAEVDNNMRVRLGQVLATLRRSQLRQAQVIVITPDSERIDNVPLGAIRAASRHLSVVTDKGLDELFDDNPLAAGEETDAA